MSCSVLTLVRNREGHLAQLVEGLRRSRTPPTELIVIDMSDRPVAVHDTDFPTLVHALEGRHLPLARARNLAAGLAGSEHLLFLDVDCIPGADIVGRVDAALGDRDALICAEVLYLGQDDARGDWTEGHLHARGRPHPVRDFPAEGSRPEPNPGLFWSLAFGVRKTTFERIGGFDERFVGYGAEDTDLGFRAAAAGLPLLFLGGAPVFHQHHPSYDPPLQHFEALIRNAQLFHEIWGTWPMQGWLDRMAALGLIDVRPDSLTVLRRPRPEETDAALRPATTFF